MELPSRHPALSDSPCTKAQGNGRETHSMPEHRYINAMAFTPRVPTGAVLSLFSKCGHGFGGRHAKWEMGNGEWEMGNGTWGVGCGKG